MSLDVKNHRNGGLLGTGSNVPRDVGALPISPEIKVALLTGGSDKPYVYGLATALGSQGVQMDLIGSDELDEPELRRKPGVNFLNLRGDQRPNAGFVDKVVRILGYYAKLIRYGATSEARIFHILWNSRFEVFDRTLLTLYFKLLGRTIVLTVHNVNTGKRDFRDTFVNRLTLRIQYRLADHIFVHTERMKSELVREFSIRSALVTIIPFGINNAVPHTTLSTSEARQRLGIQNNEKTILFFGRIAPYKGLDCLIAAFRRIMEERGEYRLIIAGRPERGCEEYWNSIREAIREDVREGRILVRAEFIPDEETEVYFKTADILVLPYKHVYQSGVLFLGYSFGLPVIAADVGSLKEEIVEGETGFAFAPGDAAELAIALKRYFASDLFASLGSRRRDIQSFATARHSWETVAQTTICVYGDLLRPSSLQGLPIGESSQTSIDMKVPE